MNFYVFNTLLQSEPVREAYVALPGRGRFLRQRYQVLAGLLLGVVLPAMIQSIWSNYQGSSAYLYNSCLASLMAVGLSLLVQRKIAALPGRYGITVIKASLFVGYGVTIVTFFAFSLGYAKAQLAMSFLMTVGVLYIFATLSSKARKVRFLLAAGHAAPSIKKVSGVEWVRAATPEMAALYPNIPIVFDASRPELSSDWKHYLRDEAVSGRLIYSRDHFEESLLGKVRKPIYISDNLGYLAIDSIYVRLKSFFDRGAAVLILGFLSPLFLITALLIRLESTGPALFRQTRIGYRGRAFTVFKFRSMKMHTGDQDATASDMTKADDYRITKLGHFLRRSRIDELPQLINVALGEMSWIGPRPETANLSELYAKNIANYRQRHMVRPGITGWAQVRQGHVTSIHDVAEKLEYDLYYVKYFSFWLDVLIVLKTIDVVLTGRGAK